jgi:hypothetical protein
VVEEAEEEEEEEEMVSLLNLFFFFSFLSVILKIHYSGPKARDGGVEVRA